MEIIEESKAALKQIHEFFMANINEGKMENEGYKDGLSEQYNFHGIILVISKDPRTQKNEQYTYYNGNESFAEVYMDGSTNLDNEFLDEMDKVLEVHEEFKYALKVHNQKNKNQQRKKMKR